MRIAEITNLTLTFDAVDESTPIAKWANRWARSWPAYEAWFVVRGGDFGPSRAECRVALKHHMPKLIAAYDKLSRSRVDPTEQRNSSQPGVRLPTEMQAIATRMLVD